MSVFRSHATTPRNPARLALLAGVCLLTAACASTPAMLTSATNPSAGSIEGSPPADAPTAMAASEQSGADDNEVICREIEVTGTRFGERVCRTRAEWGIAGNQQRRAAREYTRQTRENAAVLNPVENRGAFGTPTATFPADPSLAR